jgi:hypothetical protein
MIRQALVNLASSKRTSLFCLAVSDEEKCYLTLTPGDDIGLQSATSGLVVPEGVASIKPNNVERLGLVTLNLFLYEMRGNGILENCDVTRITFPLS